MLTVTVDLIPTNDTDLEYSGFNCWCPFCEKGCFFPKEPLYSKRAQNACDHFKYIEGDFKSARFSESETSEAAA